MKIHSGDPSAGLPRVQQKPAGEAGSSAFSEVLAKVCGPRQAEHSAAVSSAAFLRPITADLSCQLHQGAEQVLDAMERYRALLADSRITLRQVEPALNELRKAAGDLDPVVEALPADHPEGQVARQVLLTAAVEIARFDRGEYVNG
jgi:hypothetical protein